MREYYYKLLTHIGKMHIKYYVGPSGPPKKLPTLTTDLVPAGIMEKRPFLHFAETRFLGRT